MPEECGEQVRQQWLRALPGKSVSTACRLSLLSLLSLRERRVGWSPHGR